MYKQQLLTQSNHIVIVFQMERECQVSVCGLVEMICWSLMANVFVVLEAYVVRRFKVGAVTNVPLFHT